MTDPRHHLRDRAVHELLRKLHEADVADERATKQRIESLRENVRREVKAEHAEANARLNAYEDQLDAREAAIEAREADLAAKERQATSSYRAIFVGVGASLALATDLFLRGVT